MLKLLQPEAAAAQLARQFQRSHAAWLGQPVAAPRWPLLLPLGQPTEADAAAEPEVVRAWVQAWQSWPGPGTPQWQQRQWPRLGAQRLPQALVLDGPEALADLAGQGARWRRATLRHAWLAQAWPALQAAGSHAAATSQRLFDALAGYADDDITRLAALLRWLATNPGSGLYLRQLPVPGLDTKWVEQRRALILDLLRLPGAMAGIDAAASTGTDPGRDLHTWLGLARPPARLRLRILCPRLRQQLGGLGDVETPLPGLARWPLAPQQVLVVENLESGLALPPLPGTVAVLKLGHAVGQLRALPWLAAARLLYWGDIDTHGFAMLDKARQAWPHTESLLMDAATLLAHRSLCGEEPQPYSGPPLALLRGGEREAFDGLVQGRWGVRLRLEQERLPWGEVLAALAGL